MEKVKFTDPETQEVIEFIVENETQLNGVKYLCVSEDMEDGSFLGYILKEIVEQDGEVTYEMVEDEVEFEALAKIFYTMSEDDTIIEY